MRFKNDFLLNYLKKAPAALAIERSLECEILSKQDFIPPILDLGCGDGIFSSVLFNGEIDTGIDPNEQDIKQAKGHGVYKELIQCQGSNIPGESRSFNTIFANSVLEHVFEIQPILKEAHRLLVPGGNFYITVPSNVFDRYSVLYQLLSLFRLKNLAERYRRFYNNFWRHFHHYTKDDWEKFFMDAGFVVTGSKEYGSKAICVFNNFLTHFAFLSFINKKMTNKWVICTGLRTIYIYPFYLIARIAIRVLEKEKAGGMIFFSLKKS